MGDIRCGGRYSSHHQGRRTSNSRDYERQNELDTPYQWFYAYRLLYFSYLLLIGLPFHHPVVYSMAPRHGEGDHLTPTSQGVVALYQ